MQDTSRIIRMDPHHLIAMKQHAIYSDMTLSTLYAKALSWFVDHSRTSAIDFLQPPSEGKSVTLPMTFELVEKINQIACTRGASQMTVLYTGIRLYLSHVLKLF